MSRLFQYKIIFILLFGFMVEVQPCTIQFIDGHYGDKHSYILRNVRDDFNIRCQEKDYNKIYNSLPDQAKSIFRNMLQNHDRTRPSAIFYVQKGNIETSLVTFTYRSDKENSSSQDVEAREFLNNFGIKFSDIPKEQEVSYDLGRDFSSYLSSNTLLAGLFIKEVFLGHDPFDLLNSMAKSLRDMMKICLDDLKFKNPSQSEIEAAKKRLSILSSFFDEYLGHLEAHQNDILNSMSDASDKYKESSQELDKVVADALNVKKELEKTMNLVKQTGNDFKKIVKEIQDNISKYKESEKGFLNSPTPPITSMDDELNALYKKILNNYESDDGYKLKNDPNSIKGKKIWGKLIFAKEMNDLGNREEARTLVKMVKELDLLYTSHEIYHVPSTLVNRQLNRINSFVSYFGMASNSEKEFLSKQRQTLESIEIFGDRFTPDHYEGLQLIRLSNELAEIDETKDGGAYQFITHLALNQAEIDGKKSINSQTFEDYQKFHSSLDYAWSIVDFAKGVSLGVGNATLDLVSSSIQLVTHPIESAEALYFSIANYDQTFHFIQSAIKNEIENFPSYTAEEKGRLVGNVAGQIATLFIPISKAPAFLKTSGVAKALSEITESSFIIQEVFNGGLKVNELKNVFNSARKVFENNLVKEQVKNYAKLSYKLFESGIGKIDELESIAKNSCMTKKGMPLLFDADNAVLHFKDHADQIKKVFNKPSYNLKEYLVDANHVIKTGQYSKEFNAYVKIIGGSGDAKAAFVGLKNTGENISTFHIKDARWLSKKDPSLGWSFE